MDNELPATSLAYRVTDFNVLPLGALMPSCRQSVAPVILNSRSKPYHPDRFVRRCTTQSCQVTDRVDRRS